MFIVARDNLRSPKKPAFADPVLDHNEGDAEVAGTGSGAAAAAQTAAGAAMTDAAVRSVRRLESTADLLRFRAEMPSFLEALCGLNLLPAASIASLVESTETFITTDYALGKIETALVQLTSTLAGLGPDDMMFVSRLHSHGGLIEFLATFETMAVFDTQASVVRSAYKQNKTHKHKVAFKDTPHSVVGRI